MSHTLPRGLYRHYKGNLYELLHTARHSETEEPLARFMATTAYGCARWRCLRRKWQRKTALWRGLRW